MTREPDRYEEKANELLITINPFHVPSLAAALRQAADEALERAYTKINDLVAEFGENPASALSIVSGYVDEALHGVLRRVALASPAAAPAAEPRDVVTGTARETYAGIDFTLGTEPVAPADLRNTGKEARQWCDIAETRRQRIAELERRVEAGIRYAKHRYPHWAKAGGDPECAHGIHLGIECSRCDLITLETGAERIAKVKALADGGEGKT